MRLLLIFLLLSSLHWHSAESQGSVGASPRSASSLNSGWTFYLSDSIDDRRGVPVSLPHTWNAGDGFSKEGTYRRGVGWYKRTLSVPFVRQGEKFFLHFEGANQVADVFVNGLHAGSHIGGYTAFTVDISALVRPGDENTILVRVNNSHDEDIPPLNADFTFYGGLYRDVWLVRTGMVHIDLLDYGSPGIFIDTPDISQGSGVVRIRGTIVNETGSAVHGRVMHRILDKHGRESAKGESTMVFEPGRTSFEHLTTEVQNPKLWSPQEPELYSVETVIWSHENLLDRVVHTFGFRWYSVSPGEGFRLNGERMKLIGTNRHQDASGFGNALSDSLHRRDVQLVKETGFNFLRTAHYPQDNAVLEAADRLGLVVWEEIPVVNIVSLSPRFAENSERMLVEMIRQHYNHASVAFWGYMNEVMLRKPNPVPERYYDGLIELARRLEARLKAEDRTRPSVTAISFHEIDNGTGFGDIPDVHGMNLYFGWYYEDLASWGRFLDSLHTVRPDRVYFVSEYGAGSDERVHTRTPRAFDFSSEYIQDFHMATFPQLMEREYVVGTAVWNQFDFGSDFRQDTKKGLNQKGLFFYDRTPKDVWYYYRAKLRNDPVLHIGREWLIRAGSAPGDELQSIRIFTNCDSIMVSVNGSPIQYRKPSNAFVEQEVVFRAGANAVSVRGWKDGFGVSDSVTILFEERGDLFSGGTQGERIAVNAGGHYSYTDATGLVWEADRAMGDFAWGYAGGVQKQTHRSVFDTDDDALFQAYREGDCEYRFSVSHGRYELELGFLDPVSFEAGRRVFDVAVNGMDVIQGLDIASQYGGRKAIRLKFSVVVRGMEGVRVRIRSRTGLAVISSLALVRIDR